MKLNVGCGRSAEPGYVNIDRSRGGNVDVVVELENGLPFRDQCASDFLLSHVIEHIARPLPLMAELWRIAAPGARMIIRCPYGSSDDAWEDPTHVRALFINSFGYFGQPAHWRADYGYGADWRVEWLELICWSDRLGMTDNAEAMECIRTQRNIVAEMVGHLRAVKPPRLPRREEFVWPPITLRRC